MAFSLATLNNFNLEDSGILIQKSVLGADLLQYVDVRPGYPEATVSVNVLGLTQGFTGAACGWESAGSTNFTQIEIANTAKSWKQSLCLEDLRQYWLSTLRPIVTGKQIGRAHVCSSHSAKSRMPSSA